MRDPIIWLSRCLLTALIVIVACRIPAGRVGGGVVLPAVTTRDASFITFNRYVREPTPQVVLVGSSLAYRLREEYFANPSVRNLAVAGGSPITGLRIVANQRELPKLILIEINVLSRPVDAALVDRYSSKTSADPLFIRPIRIAVAAYESWRREPPDSSRRRRELDSLLKQPPSDFDNHVFAERALQEMNEEYPEKPVLANVEVLKKLVDELEERGARAFLVEVPYSPPIEGSRFATATREIVHQAFPDPAQWLPIDPPTAELRWSDGEHLDERSAALVVRSIEKAIAERSGAALMPSN